jgi:hypothetical protein
MQDCCRTAPRRARYLAILLVILAAVTLALLERGGTEPEPVALQRAQPSPP